MEAFLLAALVLYLRAVGAAPDALLSDGVDDSNISTDAAFSYDARIVGGYSTSIAAFPYQASLQYQGSHICGGSIVAAYLVLTAAHCIERPLDTASYSVRVGSSRHSSGGQLLVVRAVLLHESYDNATHDCDVALVELAAAIDYSPSAVPVPLAASHEGVPEHTQLLISGWGLTSETGSVSPVLRYVVVELLPRAICATSYREIADITERMFCAGNVIGGKDSCQGDSGGPLVGRLEGRLKLVGLASWGVGCAQAEFPGVYADVAALRPWIDRGIKYFRWRAYVTQSIAF